MNKAFLRIIIIVLAIAIIVGVLFVLSRKKYEFDFEGRVKILEKISQTQREYPNATVLIPDDSKQLPKTLPAELTYKNAKLASLEQLSSQGVSYVLISSDAKGEINNIMSSAIQKAGWELLSKSEDIIEAKKDNQKTKIFLEKEEDHVVITVAYTYDL